MDAAYRRLHATLVSALSFITVIEKIAYLLLRLPFGAKIAANRFSIVSDMINDLATELSLDLSWNPDEVKSNLYNLIESLPTKEEHDDTPFGQAEELLCIFHLQTLHLKIILTTLSLLDWILQEIGSAYYMLHI